MQNSESWSRRLFEKEKSFLLLKPLLDLSGSIIKDPEYAYLCNEYDSMAIGLKMIETVIDNTMFMNLENQTGISKGTLFEKLCTEMSKIDKFRKKNIPKSHKMFLLDRILHNLISPGKDAHIMRYINYSDPNSQFGWQTQSFQLLQIITTPDDEIAYVASPKLLNIFTSILDMKIEDQQKAILYMLELQIQRRDFETAVKTAKDNLIITMMYYTMIQDIIFKTKRKYRVMNWLAQYPKTLTEARDHIGQCLSRQKNQQAELLNKHEYILDEDTDAKKWLKELKDNLERSNSMLLPLLKAIKDAREAVYNQAIGGINSDVSKAFSIEDDYFPRLLTLPRNHASKLLQNANGCVNSCHFKKITSLSSTVDLLIKQDLRQRKRELNFRKNHRIVRKHRKRVIDQESFYGRFSKPLRLKAIQLLTEILEKNEDNKMNFEQLCKKLDYHNVDEGIFYYIQLLILGIYADIDFEKYYTAGIFRTALIQGNFENRQFTGRNFMVNLLQKKFKEKL
ncbi:hypothetical protein [Candidatus Lokiarchaeum ossiferum]|uniref:hypothetical protein n=1 Tax=Candidatus Lokiarchaeum ossiferum TaxID=2951803 RepID=UPI00352F503E